MIKMGIIDAKCRMSPRDEQVQAWDSLSEEEQDQEDLKMAVYCAMVDRMDQNLGRLFEKVKELGQWDNTLIMFVADNGACDERVKNRGNKKNPGPPGRLKVILLFPGVGPMPATHPIGNSRAAITKAEPVGPYIAHWPSVIKPGTMTDQVVHVIDYEKTVSYKFNSAHTGSICVFA